MTNTFAGYSCCTRIIVIHRAPKKNDTIENTPNVMQRERQCVSSYVAVISVAITKLITSHCNLTFHHIEKYDVAISKTLTEHNLCVSFIIFSCLFTSIFLFGSNFDLFAEKLTQF